MKDEEGARGRRIRRAALALRSTVVRRALSTDKDGRITAGRQAVCRVEGERKLSDGSLTVSTGGVATL